jgi:trehalose 6-phosphate phosphatase
MSQTDQLPRAPSRRARAIPLPQMSWAYFFDIDGTLLDIAPTPGGVHVDRELCELIQRLHAATGGAVALISGRSIDDIDSIFHGDKLPAAGQHGIERRDATGHVSRHAFNLEPLARMHERLARTAGRYPGQLLLEDKGLSLALHYRLAPQLGGFANRLVRSMQRELGADYVLQRGKLVVELKPAGKDKGSAIFEFMQEAPFRGRTPVFVGDDVTDEYGFAMVNQLAGHSVKVGGGRSTAKWRLRNVRDVRDWVARGLTTDNGAPVADTEGIVCRHSISR